MSTEESYDTIIIGGGQAGLAAGYFLQQQSRNYVILEAGSRIGESWRKRWDSLRLFTPAKFNGLPGMSFPAEDDYFPTKDEVADYLEAYVTKNRFPIRLDTAVEKLERNSDGYRLTAGNQTLHARHVIVATGAYQSPNIPSFSKELDQSIVQLHSSAYRKPEQIPGDGVLVVGAGNSGAEIGLELARVGRKVWLSGRSVGHIPANQLGKILRGNPYWWFISHVLSIDTPLGRKMRTQVLHHGSPLIRSDHQEIFKAGIQPVSRLAGVQAGRPRLQDGSAMDVSAVVWATGFHPDYTWIDLPIFDESGLPLHTRGVVPGAGGLYFLGLHFQTALTSALLGGVGRDARYISQQIQ